MYGLFGVKNLDWNAVYRKYRPRVINGMTDRELFTVFSGVLGELNDGHVWLLTTGPDFRRYDSGPRYDTGTFSLEVAQKYLRDLTDRDGAVIYGKLTDKVGYIYFRDFGLAPAFYEKAMDDALAALADARGIVVDVRNLAGGDDRSAQHVAGRFASEQKLYMRVRFRNGPAHTDFSAPTEWMVRPSGRSQFTKPVVLLTNRITESAGETFTLAMNQNANVTQVGDTTFGVFSENPRRELPNGWIYTISVGDYRAADGKSYEGVGIAPKLRILNTREELDAGKDRMLEKALDLLK